MRSPVGFHWGWLPCLAVCRTAAVVVPLSGSTAASADAAQQGEVVRAGGDGVVTPLVPLAAAAQQQRPMLWWQEALLQHPPPGTNYSLLHQRTRSRFPRVRRREAQPPLHIRPDPAKVVWIDAYARSSSSTLLSLVSHVNVSVFTIYEPCHAKDKLDPGLAAQGCQGLLGQLARCNFTGVEHLWGWTGPHQETNPAFDYTPEAAQSACAAADMVAIKTIGFGHNLSGEALPLLRADPRIRLVDLVRDPRSIYASMQHTHGDFEEADRGAEGLISMCDHFRQNLDVQHPEVHRVLYEDLVTTPLDTARRLYAFLGFGVSNETSDWINATFDGGCLRENDFSDCRSNSSEHTAHYKELTNDEFALFMGHQQCREVSSHYRWNTWYFNFPSGAARARLAAALATAIGAGLAHFLP